MRQIKFRGQKINTKEWVYGSLLMSEIDTNEINVTAQIHGRFANSFSIWSEDVIPETVGEFTGLQDQSGKDIYEGDIVKSPYSNSKVIFNNGCFGAVIKNSRHGRDFHSEGLSRTEIIGNIHEHPELLK